jgi:hypothetical protein
VIDSAHDGRQHTDIGLGTGDDEAVRLSGAKSCSRNGSKNAEYLVLSITSG